MRTGEVQADAVVQKVPTEHHSEFQETVSYSRPVWSTHILTDKQCYMSSEDYAATKYNLNIWPDDFWKQRYIHYKPHYIFRTQYANF